jgi:hypothetical protein
MVVPESHQSDGGNGRVLQFRPRHDARRGRNRGNPLLWNKETNYSPVSDLTKYERASEAVDDYRHRMIVNVIAFVYVSMLVLAGVWLATSMAHAREIAAAAANASTTSVSAAVSLYFDCLQVRPRGK